MRSFILCQVCALFLALTWNAGSQTTGGTPAAPAQTMSLDVKETDISDVIRMISKGYNLSIILDNDVTGKVTLHLSDVPILEGLKSLAESQGLEVVPEGNVYRIRKIHEEKRLQIAYRRGLLTADVHNVDVLDFIKDVSSKSGVSIVPDSRISGTVSGKLYGVPLEDGLKALLEGNGFTVVKKKNIYRVEQESSLSGGQPDRPMHRRVEKGEFYVDYTNSLLSLDVMGANLADVIEAIAKQAEIEMVTYGQISDQVNAKLNNIALTEAFALLLGGTQYTFIQKENVLLIGDRNTATPSGQALSTSELINLRHIKAEDVPAILPKNIPATNVKVVKEQNALLISGTSEDIVATRDFLDKIDIPTPQVIIDAIVVEYSREMGRDFGFEMGYDPKGEKGSNAYSFPYSEANRKGSKARAALAEVFPKMKLVSGLPDNFYMSLRLLEDEGKAKVLAQPTVTVLNGNKASINVGQTQYFKIIAGTSDNPTYRFQPISFGIKLDITPWISQGGQITAVIAPEISNAMGQSTDGYPNVFTRAVSTTVRLEDGQTLVLGGLLRSEEQISHKKVPVLGDIPVLGYLFKTTNKKKIQTNLVLYITPHVVDKNGIVDLDKELEEFDKKADQGFRDDSFRESNSAKQKKPGLRERMKERREQRAAEKSGASKAQDQPPEQDQLPEQTPEQTQDQEPPVPVVNQKSEPVQSAPAQQENSQMPEPEQQSEPVQDSP